MARIASMCEMYFTITRVMDAAKLHVTYCSLWRCVSDDTAHVPSFSWLEAAEISRDQARLWSSAKASMVVIARVRLERWTWSRHFIFNSLASLNATTDCSIN